MRHGDDASRQSPYSRIRMQKRLTELGFGFRIIASDQQRNGARRNAGLQPGTA